MTITKIRECLKSDAYSFLSENEHLNRNIILLGLGGSHAYGTNIEGSDLDIRGCALNSKAEILTNANFKQFTNDETDTVIYSFNKLISLLTNCNPNVIEILGLKPEHYVYLSPIGQELLDNKQLFLSKKAINAFGGYASAQLRRLDNKSTRTQDQAKKEEHILKSIENASHTFAEKYFEYPSDAIHLYVDKSDRDDIDSEIFMDINLSHYPLRDYKSMWSEMNTIVKEYGKIGQRNSKAVTHDKLGKHMMHLIRLYMMCLDILEKSEIITYRDKEHDLLMSIRNGAYLKNNSEPIPEFFEMVHDYETKMEYAKQNTLLPDKPNYKQINEFVMSVNERVIRNEF